MQNPRNLFGEKREQLIGNIARCLLKDAEFPKSLWGEMFLTATYLAKCMSHSALQSQTPLTILFGVPTKLDHLHTIGAKAFVDVERFLKDKAWKGTLCGYSMNSK